MDEELRTLARFARSLRDEGVAVGTGRVAEFCRAAALLPPHDLYWAGRATLIASPREVPLYDEVFAAFFGGTKPAGSESRMRVSVSGFVEPVAEVALASPVELLREKSFAGCDEDELAVLAELMKSSVPIAPLRRSRRLTPAGRGVPDLRRTLRRSFRTGGDPVGRAWRARRRRPRRVVLILDVSGSMSDYSRALLMFAHAVVRGNRHWEAFCFGTRLTRVTAALAGSDVNAALSQAAGDIVDWGAGTRIGPSLKTFLDDYGHRGLARGAVVVISSDGLEIGDPDLLAEQAARLARLAHRVIWLNPLKGDPAYEPLTRGMRAALPHIDTLASGHNLASLEELAQLLRALSIGHR